MVDWRKGTFIMSGLALRLSSHRHVKSHGPSLKSAAASRSYKQQQQQLCQCRSRLPYEVLRTEKNSSVSQHRLRFHDNLIEVTVLLDHVATSSGCGAAAAVMERLSGGIIAAHTNYPTGVARR